MKDPLWDVISKEVQSKEYIDGRNARFNGFFVTDNPYSGLAHVEEYLEWNPDGENIRKYQDWDKGWTIANQLKERTAEAFEKMKNSTPPPEDQFVKELEALLSKYDYDITGVNNEYGLLYFKQGHRWRYDFAAGGEDGRYTAARPIGG